MDELRLLGEDPGERATARSHLENDIFDGDIQGDDASGVRIFQEVLAEAFFGKVRFGPVQR